VKKEEKVERQEIGSMQNDLRRKTKAQLEELILSQREEIEKGQKEIEDLKERIMRIQAEFENARKRLEKEKAEFIKFSHEEIIRELIPVIDNLERALEHAGDASNHQSLKEGVEMIYQQLVSTLEKFGLTREEALGKPFDPSCHEAMMQIETDDHPPNTVVEEHRKAYFLKGRLIRPAMVTVSKPSDQGGREEETLEQISQ
jgi:molecular chaperone GrpE